ncbi:ABC transporter ATP-binding protein [Nocardioides alcanivorans]|uniref:ABC transporter ATP-binding protein n=1 Tax=Nocardioides alcanivorans TaxID=2897352 RepID=UPI001F17DB99|nr:ABC transporter ATP-binding protein [Nocardioides alcanivorans]
MTLTPERTPILSVKDLTVEFRIGGNWTPVVTGVSLDVASGETLAIVGESGSGKSVTSMSLMRLLPPRQSRVASGSITFDKHDLLAMKRRELNRIRGAGISMIFQEPMTSLNPAYTVGEQIAEVVRRHKNLGRREAFTVAIRAMESVGIPQAARRARAYPHEFSGGMRQRIMIAMAVCCEPRLLIADEPTTALDVTIQAQILDLLRELQRDTGMGMIFVTHDLGVVAEVADRVAVMYAGNIVEQASVHDLYSDAAHPYTHGLLKSMPTGARHSADQIYSIQGAPPRPVDFPPGCRFAPRCSFAAADCAASLDLVEVEEAHAVRCVRHGEIDLKVEPSRPEGVLHV